MKIFEMWMKVLGNFKIPKSVLNQFFYQTIHFFSVTGFFFFFFPSFQLFSLEPEAVRPHGGDAGQVLSELPQGVGGLQQAPSLQVAGFVFFFFFFLKKPQVFESQLVPVVDLTNLLLLEKSKLSAAVVKFFIFISFLHCICSFVSPREAVPSLSLRQVKHVLDRAGEVPLGVRRSVAEAASLDVSYKSFSLLFYQLTSHLFHRVPLQEILFVPKPFFSLRDLMK